MDEQPARGVQTALRAISILEAFSASDPSMTLSQMSEAVALSVPTTHRLLRALQSRDLVIYDQTLRRYSLGFGIMSLAKVILQRGDLVTIAHPVLERLRRDTMETVSLQTVVGDQRLAVAELVSQHPIRMASGIGAPYPLVRGAAGKAILSAMSDKEIDRLVATVPDPERLRAELETIASDGYAVSVGEVVAGAASLAAPVRGIDGVVLASLNVTGPADRFDAARIESTKPLLVRASAELASLMSGRTISPGGEKGRRAAAVLASTRLPRP